jgi:hypothetical protein
MFHLTIAMKVASQKKRQNFAPSVTVLASFQKRQQHPDNSQQLDHMGFSGRRRIKKYTLRLQRSRHLGAYQGKNISGSSAALSSLEMTSNRSSSHHR